MVDFPALDSIAPGASLKGLAKRPLRDLQRALSFLAYMPGVIDGLYGPKTRNAWDMFKSRSGGDGESDVLDSTSLEALTQGVAAVNAVIAEPAPDTAAVKRAIVATCRVLELAEPAQIAYVLATARWETAHTFRPVKEGLGLSEGWRQAHLHYYPYYGRGYVQLTWKRNYDAYGKILALPLVDQPDLALEHGAALFVLVHGFKTGTFTNHKLVEYVSGPMVNFRAARYCINGQDRAVEIAALAEGFLDEV